MAPDPPLANLALAASSVADDLGYAALADLAMAIRSDTSEHRIIGGHMITVLAARWSLSADLYRETGDADLGVTPVAVRNSNLLTELKTMGYDQLQGNRFARTISDIPVELTGAASNPRQAIIDVLVPAYTSHAHQNVKITDDLITTEVPGLAAALGRPPVIVALELRRINGLTMNATLPFPDELSALVLKALATRVRNKPTDVTDIWRCLEIALAAGVAPRDFSRSGREEAADIIRTIFHRRQGHGMTVIAQELGLSAQGADQLFTRIKALVDRVVGPHPHSTQV